MTQLLRYLVKSLKEFLFVHFPWITKRNSHKLIWANRGVSATWTHWKGHMENMTECSPLASFHYCMTQTVTECLCTVAVFQDGFELPSSTTEVTHQPFVSSCHLLAPIVPRDTAPSHATSLPAEIYPQSDLLHMELRDDVLDKTWISKWKRFTDTLNVITLRVDLIFLGFWFYCHTDPWSRATRLPGVKSAYSFPSCENESH